MRKNYIFTAALAFLQSGPLVDGFQLPAPQNVINRASNNVQKSCSQSQSQQHSLSSASSSPLSPSSFQPRTLLKASTSSSSESSSESSSIDLEAIGKYGAAAVIQLSLISALLAGLDYAIPTISGGQQLLLPTPITWILFYGLSLKSRVFNPLNNSRPDRTKAVSEEGSAGFKDRIQPSWTPPGFIFPIVWILLISPLRATSSTLLVGQLASVASAASAAGSASVAASAADHVYFTLPIMSLMLHLTCGDVWNTINNTEKRYGTSVLGIGAVYTSAAFAAMQYYAIYPLAGKLLGATLIWLTIASSLIVQTWRLNVDGESGEKDSLLPMRGEGEESKTQFSWF